jgi:hypothetical protein
VRVPHLASRLLSLLTKWVSSDWQRKYGHPIYLLETFVEPERFAGATYRAANWIHVGQTQGRGRQGPSPGIRSASIKDVYLSPSHPGFGQPLRGETPSQGRPGRIIREGLDRPNDAVVHLARQAGKIFLRGAFKQDAIHGRMTCVCARPAPCSGGPNLSRYHRFRFPKVTQEGSMPS